jgi:hypothetical protein
MRQFVGGSRVSFRRRDHVMAFAAEVIAWLRDGIARSATLDALMRR